MQYKMFSVPADEGYEEAEALNRFLRAQRIVSVDKVFRDGDMPRWYFAVEYLEGTRGDAPGRHRSRRVDYKEILSPEDFTVFSRLRGGVKATMISTYVLNRGVAFFKEIKPTISLKNISLISILQKFSP